MDEGTRGRPRFRERTSFYVLITVVSGTAAFFFGIVACVDAAHASAGFGAALLGSMWTWFALLAMGGFLGAGWFALDLDQPENLRRRLQLQDVTRRFGWIVLVLAGAVGVALLLSGLATGGADHCGDACVGRPRRRRLRARCSAAAFASAPASAPASTSATDVANVFGHLSGPSLTVADCHALGESWSRAARFEAESVDAFLQLAAELGALDAPDELVRWARRSAQEEVRHAEVSAALAALFADRSGLGASEMIEGRGRLPSSPRWRVARQRRLVRLAVESYVDGCCNEGAEVLRLRLAASRSCPVVDREILAIARDEASHAELAWAIVAWAAREGGPCVAGALKQAAERLMVVGPTSEADEDDALVMAWGWTSPAERAACWARACGSAERRLNALI